MVTPNVGDVTLGAIIVHPFRHERAGTIWLIVTKMAVSLDVFVSMTLKLYVLQYKTQRSKLLLFLV